MTRENFRKVRRAARKSAQYKYIVTAQKKLDRLEESVSVKVVGSDGTEVRLDLQATQALVASLQAELDILIDDTASTLT